MAKKCRYFVYPSYYPEGVPRCAIQAIATGRQLLHVMFQDVEVVENEKNGFVVHPRNCKELAEKMIWMIENPQTVNKMANESRKLATEKFDVYTVNKIIIEKLL